MLLEDDKIHKDWRDEKDEKNGEHSILETDDRQFTSYSKER
mgnify:CR=1 FL=1